MNVAAWIEAMRLRTLPVSVAGVLTALGYSKLFATPDYTIFAICLLFAITAQIASNFANEYFDFRAGFDSKGRQGPRRGVTEGDITPAAMKRAVFITLAIASVLGLLLVCRGGIFILLCGIAIIAGALAYSAGPFPLSRYCLGEVAVIVFFGIAPVTLTFYLMAGYIIPHVWLGAIAIGLMGANVLLVNNIRDIPDDRKVHKYTLASVFGRKFASFLYLLNGWVAVWLMGSTWLWIGSGWCIIPSVFLFVHTILWFVVDRRSLKAKTDYYEAHTLTPCLGMTAVMMAVYSLAFVVAVFC